jgi:hypothetical protein
VLEFFARSRHATTAHRDFATGIEELGERKPFRTIILDPCFKVFSPMSQRNSSQYLSCTLAAACHCLKTLIANDDEACLRTFIDQLEPIVKSTWRSRQYIEGDLTKWTLLGELLSVLGKEVFKSRCDLIPSDFPCSHYVCYLSSQWNASHL